MKLLNYCLLGGISILFCSWVMSPHAPINSYKCLVQLTNYTGEGAYLVASVVGPDGYEKTLHVLGEDEKWYHDLTSWWTYFEASGDEIDGISGATIAGGERAVFVLDVDQDKFDAGYKLRFETAVEDQEYFVDDVEINLDTDGVVGKFDGKGYIRYVRLIPN